MKIIHNNAIVYVYGKINRNKIEEATIIFMRKVQRSKIDGNYNKTGNIKEE